MELDTKIKKETRSSLPVTEIESPDLAASAEVLDGRRRNGVMGVSAILHGVTRLSVHYAERLIPDPFLLAALLTFITFAAAQAWTDRGVISTLDAWYDGLWNILAFTMQMVLILSTGVALAQSPPVKRTLQRLAAIPRRQISAARLVFLTAAAGCFINWGFGLVIGALLAREITKRLSHVDFSFLVSAAYMGFIVWASGLSSSIALASSTPGSALNVIEKLVGHITPLGQTVFSIYNLVAVGLVVMALTAALGFMAPAASEMKRIDPQILVRQDAADEAEAKQRRERDTFASRLENAWIINILLVLTGAFYEWHIISTKGFSLDFNGFIFSTLILGLALQGTPIRYVQAFGIGARTVGPILLQFPIYGGIMGIMAHTGLGDLISCKIVALATRATLPFWSFISSCFLSVFVPSGGGQWAVQGPIVVSAAMKLQADPAMAAMGSAMGAQTVSMVQPFWALPVLALARLGIRDIMGYCVIAMAIGSLIYCGTLLVFSGGATEIYHWAYSSVLPFFAGITSL